MKGKTTLLGVKRKITLWNASSVEVWYRELSFSTSLRTLLLVSIFSTLQRALEPRDMKHEVNKNSKLTACCHKTLSTIDNYTPGWNHFLRSLLWRTGCLHCGKRGLSWVCMSCMWFTKDVHLATFSGPEEEDVAHQYTWLLILRCHFTTE